MQAPRLLGVRASRTSARALLAEGARARVPAPERPAAQREGKYRVPRPGVGYPSEKYLPFTPLLPQALRKRTL